MSAKDTRMLTYSLWRRDFGCLNVASPRLYLRDFSAQCRPLDMTAALSERPHNRPAGKLWPEVHMGFPFSSQFISLAMTMALCSPTKVEVSAITVVLIEHNIMLSSYNVARYAALSLLYLHSLL